ncbi:hypothetical protein T02_11390 [Trichinella nativa]|uniref:Uncharacterized protein n=1 Tax=Trichinella nativa TaxID=6335 RepID=A0A0V1KJ05_9BILA|nr:hypothetical protein T02_11390 [Trichinella nativa]
MRFKRLLKKLDMGKAMMILYRQLVLSMMSAFVFRLFAVAA